MPEADSDSHILYICLYCLIVSHAKQYSTLMWFVSYLLLTCFNYWFKVCSEYFIKAVSSHRVFSSWTLLLLC